MTEYTQYVEDCTRYLSHVGVTVSTSDDFLRFCIERAIYRILNLTNLEEEVPKRLKFVLITMACGFYLENQYNTGKLEGVISFEKPVKAWTMGDTSYTYRDSMSPEENFAAFINTLIEGKVNEIVKFRKIKW